MARTKPYRQASGAAAPSPARPQPARWAVGAAFLGLVLVTIMFVAGEYSLTVLETLLYGVFPLTVVAAAGVLGLALTVPLARRGVFVGSPWPDAWRLVVAIALGLGAMGLLTLLVGTLGMAGERWFAPALLVGGVAAGFVPARAFFGAFDWTPLKAPARGADWLVLLAALPVAMLLLAATYPPGTIWAGEGLAYDVREYHLQLPREYMASGSTAPVGHNVYSYFPAQVEMLYLLLMQLAALGMHTHDPLQGIFPAQLMHAGLMLLTAAAVGLAPLRIGALGRALAVVLLLATPWTIVCGSLAYNEGGVMFFGALALGLAAGGVGGVGGPRNAGATVAIGILLGLAVGCKLTAGVFVAVPVGLMVLLGGRWKTVLAVMGIALLVYAPWALRAAIASGGNPVFPMAANVLGRDGWTTEQVERWNGGHTAMNGQMPLVGRVSALGPELLLNAQWSPGMAQIDRWRMAEPDAARVTTPWWKKLGILWLVLPIAVVLALVPGANRAAGSVAAAWMLAVVLALQVLAWLFLTRVEAQARFLLPCLLPLCWLAGLGIEAPGAGRAAWLRGLICAFIGVQAATCVLLLIPERALFHGSLVRDPATGEPLYQPIGRLLEHEETAGKTVYFLGNAAPLYYRGRIIYNTVFDTNLLAGELRTRGPEGAAAWLAAQRVDELRVNWNEIERLRNSYGYDAAITPESVAAIARAARAMTRADGSRLEVLEYPMKDQK